MRTTNGGATWISQTSGTTFALYGVSFTDQNNGIVVGSSGKIMRTTNGGATWISQTSGTTKQLSGVSFIDVNNGTVVGDGGTILRTTNGGTTWNTQISGTTSSFKGVSFIDQNIGTAVGGYTILRTTNGGATWIAQSSGTTNYLYGVAFTDVNNGTAIGLNGTILRTTNGGATWIAQSSGTTNHLYGVSFTDENNGTAVGYGGTILETTNSGTLWTAQFGCTDKPLNSVSRINLSSSTLVGKGGIIIRKNAELVGNTIIRIPNGGENWQVDGTYDIAWNYKNVSNVKLDYTTDNGVTWLPIIASTPSDGSYSWTIPNTPSTQCKVRITDVDNPSISDESDGVFQITPEFPELNANYYVPNSEKDHSMYSDQIILDQSRLVLGIHLFLTLPPHFLYDVKVKAYLNGEPINVQLNTSVSTLDDDDPPDGKIDEINSGNGVRFLIYSNSLEQNLIDADVKVVIQEIDGFSTNIQFEETISYYFAKNIENSSF